MDGQVGTLKTQKANEKEEKKSNKQFKKHRCTYHMKSQLDGLEFIGVLFKVGR